MLRVIHPGLFTTVQDLGRDGYTHLGVSPAGAADSLLLRAGNLMLGNAESEAGLEFTLSGGHFGAETDMYVLVAGDVDVEREGLTATPWRALRLKRGQTLNVGKVNAGLRAYLCVAGGLEVPEWLGSASTHTPSGMGGWKGRALQKGDGIPLRMPRDRVRRRGLPPALRMAMRPRTLLRLTLGPHAPWLRAHTGHEIASWLEAASWLVLPASNRMGLRLAHAVSVPQLANTEGTGEVLSVGVPLGAVQVTPSGQLLLLGPDAQTTGGYPIAAAVISADFPAMGQLRPGDSVHFKVTDFATARQLLLRQEALLSTLRQSAD